MKEVFRSTILSENKRRGTEEYDFSLQIKPMDPLVLQAAG